MIHKATVAITHKREREGESERERETLAPGGVGEGRGEEAGRRVAGRGGLSAVNDSPASRPGARGERSAAGRGGKARGHAGLEAPESPRGRATTRGEAALGARARCEGHVGGTRGASPAAGLVQRSPEVARLRGHPREGVLKAMPDTFLGGQQRCGKSPSGRAAASTTPNPAA